MAPEQDWVGKTRALAPVVAKWREESERQRRLPAEALAEIKASGLLRLMLPRRLGGHQADVASICAAVREMSRMDGAFGWNLMISGSTGLFADYFPESAEKELFATGDEIGAGSFAPTGQAIVVPGGYQVTGRWGFASGCLNADWMLGGFIVIENGQPKLNAAGVPDILLLAFPKSECEIEDTWYTAGMRGTGSHDFNIKDVFVPAARGFLFSQFAMGPGDDRGGYLAPFPHIIGPAMASVALGIARDAIETFREIAAKKTPRGSASTLATQHSTHMRLGEAEALLRAAEAYLDVTVREIDGHDYSDRSTLEELSAAVRLAGAQAVKLATEAVDIVFDLGGGSAIYESSRLERCFRDIHMVSHHIMVSPSNIEMVGQYLLGLGLKARR